MGESESNRFDALMRTGQVAYIKGYQRKAHQTWREAATLNPHDEDVWKKLLNVVETDADKRVCLENIIVINPKNTWATRQLAALDAHREGTAPARPAALGQSRRVVAITLIVIKYGLLGIALGLAISALVQGGGL